MTGTRPKQRCEYCGCMLIAQAMSRHTGTEKCLNMYWRRRLSTEYACPPGWREIDGRHTTLLLPLCKKAGLRPDTQPLQKRVVWTPRPEGYYDAGPQLVPLVPTWLALVLDMLLTEHLVARKAQRLARYNGDSEAVTHTGAYGVFEQDVITLLVYFQSRTDEAACLAVELDLVARRTENSVDWYDAGSVREVLRRWASGVLTNL